MQKKTNKKSKYVQFKNFYPKLSFSTFLITLLCSFLLVIATFTIVPLGQLSIPNDFWLFSSDFFSRPHCLEEFLKQFYYIPQIPAVLFIGALLGPRLGFFAVAIYLIAGLLGFPVFALGGGINYFSKLGSGYILGYFAGIYTVSVVLRNKITNFTSLKASILGVLAIHAFGIIYLGILMLIYREQFFLALNWIWVLSGMQIVYDLLISFIAVLLARPFKAILWLIMK